MKIQFAAKPDNVDLYLIGFAKDTKRKGQGPYADIVDALLDANPEFKGDRGEVVTSVIPGADYRRFGLIGLGDVKTQPLASFEIVGGKLCAAMITRPIIDVYVDAPMLTSEQVASIGLGAALRSYEFKKYKTKGVQDVLPDEITFSTAEPARARKIYAPLEAMRAAVFWARDLVNEPANILHPDSFTKAVQAQFKDVGVKVRVVDAKALEAMGAEAIVGVGKASEYPARIVFLEYNGLKGGKSQPVALVGKGITYDTGGYSLKTGDGLLGMNGDMAGAAAVAGAVYALAKRREKVHVVGALAIAENMISDEAYKPTDILKSLSGQTIEITNTDAEGRLVLADTMWHVQNAYKPRTMIDIATLTGAAMGALGEEYAAVFANDDAMFEGLQQSSVRTNDKVWRMPLDSEFDKLMDSTIADMRNASATRLAGACTAACFLQRFVQNGVTWAHIDMAPTMVTKVDKPLCPIGATGFGVRLLADWVACQA